MLRIRRPGIILSMLMLCLSLLVSGQTAQAADDNLNIVFTTTNAGGSYGTKHVHAVWITDTSGNWIHTVGTNSTNKRALWANARASSLKRWYTPNPSRSSDIAARTGATQTAYTTYNLNWNWRKLDGSEVADGTYRVHLECTNSDSGTPSNYTYLTITKGSSSQTVGPVTQGGYNNVKLIFTPGTVAASPPTVRNGPASGITFNSARLNGALDSTGGENPAVYIYWGDNDGGTNTAAWDHPVNLGTKSTGSFYSDISGLSPDTNYYFRCYAVNSGGSAWASSTTTFKTAIPAMPAINISPAGLTFPDTAVKANNNMIFNIQNTGAAALTINSLTIVGLDSSLYSLISPPATPFNVPAASSQQITVRFSPTSTKNSYAQIAVASNDSDNLVALMQLTGKGIANPAILIPPAAAIGGLSNAVALNGSNVLLAQGSSLTVINASDTANPSKLASVDIGDIIQNISVTGNVAYVAAGNLGFAVVDLSNPAKPKVAVYDTAGFAYDLASTSSTLCIADGSKGLAVYNISNPLAPTLQGTYATQGCTTDVSLTGTAAYILDDQLGLQIVSTSTRTLTGALNKIEFGQAIAILGTKVYITDRMGELFIVNIASPATMSILSQIKLQGGLGKNIAVSGSYAYITTDTGIEIVNIANSSAPVSTGIYSAAGAAADIIINATTAYIACPDKGVTVLNLSNPASPVKLGGYELQSSPMAAQANNSIIYVADNKGLKIIDMSKLQNPASLSLTDTGGQPQSIALSGNTAYIANGLAGLQIVNITNPQAPVLLANFQTEGFASNVAVSANNAMVTAGDKVYVLNVTNPASPSLKGTLLLGGWPGAVAISGSYGYIANGGYGLDIINLSNTSHVGNFDTPGNAYGIAVAGNIAYIADGEKGLQIINVQSPSSPTLIASFDTPGIAMDVKVVGQRVCVADNFGGVSVIDVSNPSLPTLYAKSQIPLRAASTAIIGSRMVAIDRRAGLVVLNTQTQPTTLQGDIYTDNKVDVFDLKLLADNWLVQETSLNAMLADINNDDIVNYLDFSALAKKWLMIH